MFLKSQQQRDEFRVYLVCGILGQLYLERGILWQEYRVCSELGQLYLEWGILGQVYLVCGILGQVYHVCCKLGCV